MSKTVSQMLHDLFAAAWRVLFPDRPAERYAREADEIRAERSALVYQNQKLEAQALDLHSRWAAIAQDNTLKKGLLAELVLTHGRIKANRSRLDALAVQERSRQQLLDAERVHAFGRIDEGAYDDAILEIQERNQALAELRRRQADYEKVLDAGGGLEAEAAEGGGGLRAAGPVALPAEVERFVRQLAPAGAEAVAQAN